MFNFKVTDSHGAICATLEDDDVKYLLVIYASDTVCVVALSASYGGITRMGGVGYNVETGQQKESNGACNTPDESL